MGALGNSPASKMTTICAWCGKRRKKPLLYQQRVICIPCHDEIIKSELQVYNQLMTRTHADVEINHMQRFQKVMSKRYTSPKKFVKALSRLYQKRKADHVKYAPGHTVKLTATELQIAQQQIGQTLVDYFRQKKADLK